MTRRVAVTGLGAVTPVGNDVDSTWKALLSGTSGVGPITTFDTTDFITKFAAEVKGFEAEKFMDIKEAKRTDRVIQLAVAGSVMAMADSGIKIETEEQRYRLGVMIGSGIGGMITNEEQTEKLIKSGPRRISPFYVPMMIANMAAGYVSIVCKAKGPNLCTVSACASGGHAIGSAFHAIKYGQADYMLAGGTEAAITRMSVGGFNACKALSVRNDDPQGASRPFDAERDGFVLGEGCGVLFLEEMESAKARGARIYAELVGVGNTADSYHITAPSPDGEGAVRSMKLSLEEGGLAPDEVGYINAHGTSTEHNDRTESLAIRKVFGAHADKLWVSSTKSMIGHLLGAAGGVEAIFSCLAVHTGDVPPTINYKTPDPDCTLDYVPNQARNGNIRAALSNSLGFGGHNVTLAFKKV